ncbi:MAG: winged helix-turn-helix transcriptional regulator [Candidatus Heimdallarchaeota archaeon]
MKGSKTLVVVLLVATSLIIVTNNHITRDSQSVSYSGNNSTEFQTQAYENETLLTHNLEVKVLQDNSLHVISTFVVINNDSLPMDYFDFEINKNISSVYVYDPLGPLPFTWSIEPSIGNKINITMRYPLLFDETYVFSISYDLRNVIYRVDEPIEYYELDFEVTHPRNSKEFNLIIVLPIDGQLIEDGIPAPTYPTPKNVYIEENLVKIIWSYEDLSISTTDVFIVRYSINIDAEPGRINLFGLYIALAFLGGAVISLLAVYLFYTLKAKPSGTELVSSLLSDTEQEVIKAINTDSGVSTQRRICDKTGYSKSKVSQILAKLEEKKVLKRERWGRTNKVTITNPTFKTIGQKESSVKDPK